MTPRFRREGALGREMVAVMPGTAPLTARWFSRRIACRSGLGGYPRLRSSASGGPNVIRGCRLTAQSTQTGTPRSRKSTTGYTPPSHPRSGCWRSSGRPLVMSSALRSDRQRARVGQRTGAGIRAAPSGLGTGNATEAARAVLDWARSSGYEPMWASGSGHRFSPCAHQARLHRDLQGRRPDPRDQPAHHQAALTGPGACTTGACYDAPHAAV